MAGLPMIFTYPFFYVAERTVIRSRSFEKVWLRMRPKFEKGIELIAQEAHPQGRSLIRKYLYHEPAVRRIINDCLGEMASTDVLSVFKQVQEINKGSDKRNKKIVEWEKDLISAPRRSRNPFNPSQAKIRSKIEKARQQNEEAKKDIDALTTTAIGKLKERGVNLTKAQLEFLLESAEGEDIASIMACADMIKQMYGRMSLQLREGKPSPELSKTYSGFHMMCCRLYFEAIIKLLRKIEKVYLPRISTIQNQATKYIDKAQEKMRHPKLTEFQKIALENNIVINKQVLEVSKFYVKHLNHRARDLLDLRDKAKLNYEVSLNTFLTLKAGAGLAKIMQSSEKDLSLIFNFESPPITTVYDISFGDQFTSVTKQLKG
ncbi:MAG: hypothetical protein LUC43_00605 [Burkholderiales bacterium]|nr:hypothetical protein [Burkholderiales bacterium]